MNMLKSLIIDTLPFDESLRRKCIRDMFIERRTSQDLWVKIDSVLENLGLLKYSGDFYENLIEFFYSSRRNSRVDYFLSLQEGLTFGYYPSCNDDVEFYRTPHNELKLVLNSIEFNKKYENLIMLGSDIGFPYEHDLIYQDKNANFKWFEFGFIYKQNLYVHISPLSHVGIYFYNVRNEIFVAELINNFTIEIFYNYCDATWVGGQGNIMGSYPVLFEFIACSQARNNLKVVSIGSTLEYLLNNEYIDEHISNFIKGGRYSGDMSKNELLAKLCELQLIRIPAVIKYENDTRILSLIDGKHEAFNLSGNYYLKNGKI